MTKKDFALIASVLRELCEDAALALDDELDQRRLVTKFQVALAKAEPNFDKDKFRSAALPEYLTATNSCEDCGEDCPLADVYCVECKPNNA